MAWSVKRKYPCVKLVVPAEIRSSTNTFPLSGHKVTVGEGGCYLTC